MIRRQLALHALTTHDEISNTRRFLCAKDIAVCDRREPKFRTKYLGGTLCWETDMLVT